MHDYSQRFFFERQSIPCFIFILPHYTLPPSISQQQQLHIRSELLLHILMQRNKVAPLESSHHNNTENRLIGMQGI